MKRLLIIPLLIIPILSYSQQYDFDSLYENSSEFKKVADASWTSHDMFEETEPLEVKLISDFRNLSKKKYKEEYQPAVLKMNFNDTVIISRDITIKARGVMRLKSCYYPPIMLNFKKSEVLVENLKSFDKLKLVQLCKKGEAYEQYVLLEYYIYKIYNILSPFSLRVRLLEVTYEDTSGKQDPRTNYSFLIEDIDQLADRQKGIEIKMDRANSFQIDEEYADIMFIFQYLIGNTDFSIAGRHNIKLLKLNDINRLKPIAIPFDFDYAGMVDAFYAVPREGIAIDDVSERFYVGNCISDERLEETVDIFIKKKEDIYNIINTAGHLTDKSKENTIRYIDDFYRLVDNKNTAVNYFSQHCFRSK